MPIAVEYDPSARVMTYRVSGDPKVDELREVIQAHLGHPAYPDGIHVLWDLRAANLSSLDSGGLRQAMATAAQRLESEPKDTRVAVIAPGDLEYGMARAYELHAGGLPSRIRVFRTDRGVESWLLRGEKPDPGPRP